MTLKTFTLVVETYNGQQHRIDVVATDVQSAKRVAVFANSSSTNGIAVVRVVE